MAVMLRESEASSTPGRRDGADAPRHTGSSAFADDDNCL